MNFKYLKLFVYLISLLMVSCQTIKIADKKMNCNNLDWFEIGRSDGALGKQSLGWQQKATTCQSFSEEYKESYINGWYAGVDEFCSSSHGFAFGKTGSPYNNVCPLGKEEAFLDAYKRGVKVFQYESDNQTIVEELARLNQEVEKKDISPAHATQKRMNHLETQLELNKALISEINREMSETSSQTQRM